jgi:hypothetical protein
MTNITIDTLHLTGYDLFSSSENFINELFPEEIGLIEGGWYGITYGYNSLSGNSFYSHSGSHGSFSGYGGYYNKSSC